MQENSDLQKKLDDNLLSVSSFCSADEVSRALRDGANPQARTEAGETALIRAASHGNEAAVQELLPVSDPLARDTSGTSALMWAAENDHAGCVNLLLKDGGTHEQGAEGMSSLAYAAEAGAIESVTLLLPVSDLSQRDRWGR